MKPENLGQKKGTGGGVQGQIFKMDICCSPGYGEPGTFYGIEKSFSTAEI